MLKTLASVLKLATELRSLSVSPARVLIRRRHPIFRAIRTLPNLQSLALRDAAQESLDLLTSLESPIQTLDLELEFVSRFVYDPTRVPLPNPIRTLARLSSTLTSLSLYNASIDNLSPEIRSPQVHDLTFGDCQFVLEPIVRAFPNLASLTFWNFPLDSHDLLDTEFEWQEDRAHNVSSTNWSRLSTLR